MRPLVGGKPLSMVLTIQMFMLMAGALIIIFTKTNPVAIGKNEVFRAGMIAVVAVFGVAWMADTVFEANLPAIKDGAGGPREDAALDLRDRAADRLQARQLAGGGNQRDGAGRAVDRRAAGLRGRVRGRVLRLLHPADLSQSDLAAIQFDRSGTTRIGKYVINHSFILPGLIGVITSCIVGYFLAAARGMV